MYAAILDNTVLCVGTWSECADAARAAHNTRALVRRISLAEYRAECESLFALSSTASLQYKRAFRGAVEEARKIRGFSVEDEAMYAQGYLPQGFGVYGESRFFRAGHSAIRETDDGWYRALRVD